MGFFSFVFSLLFILVSVAFFTFFERKILGYSHNRFGPNKVGYLGVFQPFSDALKLFNSMDYSMKNFNFFVYFCSPFLGLFLSLLLWSIYFFYGCLVFSNFSFLFFIVLSSLSVYFLLFSGWSSGSNYSLLGGYRSSAQSISYEVVMILGFLVACFCWLGVAFHYVCYYLFSNSLTFLSLGAFFCWFLSCLAECNRSPFDFSEGESELVSGFNTEYSGGLFSLIFIGEYSSIIYLSFLSSLVFLGCFNFFIFSLFLSFIYLWVRCSYPRLRFDFLMVMGWSGGMIFFLGVLYLFF